MQITKFIKKNVEGKYLASTDEKLYLNMERSKGFTDEIEMYLETMAV